MKFFLNLVVLLLCCNSVNAEESRKSRIETLLPTRIPEFDIEPYIPDDYELIEVEKGSEFFWAPKGVVEKIFEDEKSIHPPIIQGVIFPQTKDGFAFVEEMQRENEFTTSKIYWGSHEVLLVNGRFGTYDMSHIAFITLNDPNKTFIMLNLVYPKKIRFGNGNIARQIDLAFWENFLSKTKQINEKKT